MMQFSQAIECDPRELINFLCPDICDVFEHSQRASYG